MGEEKWTVLSVLRWCQRFFSERGLESPRLDAELLLSFVLGIERVALYLRFDQPLREDELARYKALIIRRARHREPVAYILGRREFWSLELEVDPRVLIPRPDTELLVEVGLTFAEKGASLRIADVGTGSGAVALALAKERPEAEVWASDLSEGALEVARANASRHSLDVHFVCGDLLSPFGDEYFDLMVSNPPYVEEEVRSSLQPEVMREPELALFAGRDGLDILKRLIQRAPSQLKAEGVLAVEMGSSQGAQVKALFEEAGFEDVVIHLDYSKLERVVSGRRPVVMG